MPIHVPNLSDVTPAGGDYEPLPDGWYNVRVTDAEEVTARTGTPGIKVTMQVIDGPHANRKIFDRIWVSEAGAGFLRQKLESMGMAIPASDFALDTGMLVGRRCAVKTSQRPYTKQDGSQAISADVAAYDKIAGADLPTGPDWRDEMPTASGGGGGDNDIPFAPSKI